MAWRGLTSAMASPVPEVSVIIPSYNARRTIEPCLRALRAQEFEGSYEVLLADSSDDGTAELVARDFPEVRLLRFDKRTLPGLARNEGIRQSKGALLAFTDADCVVPSDWLRRMAEGHAAAHCSAFGGSVTNALPRNPVAWGGLLVEFNEFLPSSPARTTELLPTCNVCYRREVFERNGLFPEDLWPSEDHIFSWRLAEAGERLWFDPSLVVRHLFRPSFGAFVRHQLRLGEASARARRLVALPNAWLVESPMRWFTPLFRLVRMEQRLFARDPLNLLRFNAFLPICFAGLLAWGIGFARAGGPRSVPVDS